MKFLAFAVAIMAAIPVLARANTIYDFNFAYQGTDGVTASGLLSGNMISAGEYAISAGSIYVQGNSALDGSGTFVPNPGTGVFQTGGGTELILGGTDSNLYVPSSQFIDDAGMFLFQMSSGLGLGLYSNGQASGYGMFGGNWQLHSSGALNVTPTPEPASLVFLGTGFAGLATLLFFKKRSERGLAKA